MKTLRPRRYRATYYECFNTGSESREEVFLAINERHAKRHASMIFPKVKGKWVSNQAGEFIKGTTNVGDDFITLFKLKENENE